MSGANSEAELYAGIDNLPVDELLDIIESIEQAFPLLKFSADTLFKVHLCQHTTHAPTRLTFSDWEAWCIAPVLGLKAKLNAGFGGFTTRGACTARLHLQVGTYILYLQEVN